MKSYHIRHSDLTIMLNVSLLVLVCVLTNFLLPIKFPNLAGFGCILFAFAYMGYHHILGYLRYNDSAYMVGFVAYVSIFFSGLMDDISFWVLSFVFAIWTFLAPIMESRKHPIPLASDIGIIDHPRQLPMIEIKGKTFNSQVVALLMMYVPILWLGLTCMMWWLEPIWSPTWDSNETTLVYLVFTVFLVGFCGCCLFAVAYDKHRREQQELAEITDKAIVLTAEKLVLIEKRQATIITWKDVRKIYIKEVRVGRISISYMIFEYHALGNSEEYEFKLHGIPYNRFKMEKLLHAYWEKCRFS